MKYKPNFNDPRVITRITNALGFTCAVLSDKPHSWSTRYIDQHIGRQDTDLGKWLRQHLLLVINDRYNKDTGECKEYAVNQLGVRYLRDVLSNKTRDSFNIWQMNSNSIRKQDLRELVESSDSNINNLSPTTYPSVHDLDLDGSARGIQWAKQEYEDELETLEFSYEDKQHRLWHPLQNVKKDLKRSIFADTAIKYQYDIECCAPTLIHQYAQKLDMDLYLFALRKYLKNRKEVRREIGEFCGITDDQAKRVVNALFAGAKIANNSQTAIYKMLNGDINAIKKLQEMQYITDLREDIKVCWDYIKPHHYFNTIKCSNGLTRRVPMNSRQKWNIYFEQERNVLESVKRYLDKTSNRYFLEHDGWTTNQIDIDDLRQYIMSETRYDINIDVEILVSPTTYPSVQQVNQNGELR